MVLIKPLFAALMLAALASSVAVAALAGAGTPKRNACGLLTRAEISTAMREPVSSTKGGRSPTGGLFCNWVGKDAGLFPKGISLIVATSNPKDLYAASGALLEKRKPVPGVGVAAVTDGNVILARSSRAMVQVGATYVNSGIALATIRGLVKKVLART